MTFTFHPSRMGDTTYQGVSGLVLLRSLKIAAELPLFLGPCVTTLYMNESPMDEFGILAYLHYLFFLWFFVITLPYIKPLPQQR